MSSSDKSKAQPQEMATFTQGAARPTINLDEEQLAFENRSIDFRTIMAIAAMAVTYEATIISLGLPVGVINFINADIGPSTQATWIATAWTLSGAVTQTITGRCSDIFGRRYMILSGNILSLVGCIIASNASAVDTVIAGMCFIGAGSGMQQIAFAGAVEIVPKKSRGIAIGCVASASLFGSAFGSPIAYALVAHHTWRWTYYVGLLVNGVALVLVYVFYWPPGFLALHPDGKTRWQQFKELDFLGLLLFGGGLTSFLLGLSFGMNPYPWSSVQVVAPTVVGAVTLFLAFPIWELYCPTRIAPLCTPALFKNLRGFTTPICTIFVQGMLLFSIQTFWPQQVQAFFTTNPTKIGWYGLAFGAGSSVGSILGGVLFIRIKHTKVQFIIATTTMTLFIGLMASVDPTTPARGIAFVTIAAFANGYCGTSGLLIVQLGASDSHIGLASGMVGTIRSIGGAVALSTYGSILHSQVQKNLVPKVTAAVIAAGLKPTEVTSFIAALTSGSAAAFNAVEGVTPAIIAVGANALKYVYSDAYKLEYLVSIAFGGIAITGACSIRSVDKLLTKEIAVRLDKPHVIEREDSEAMVLSKEVILST